MLRALLILSLLGALIGVADAQPAAPAYIALSPPTTPPTLLGSANPLPTAPSATTPETGQASAGQYQFAVDTAQSLPNQIAGALLAQVICQSQSVMYSTFTTPTATNGMGPIATGTMMDFWGASIAAVKLIGTAAGGTCSVEYFK